MTGGERDLALRQTGDLSLQCLPPRFHAAGRAALGIALSELLMRRLYVHLRRGLALLHRAHLRLRLFQHGAKLLHRLFERPTACHPCALLLRAC